MIRLFLAIASFLAVSISGMWYGFFGQPIADTAFENAEIIPEPEEKTEEMPMADETIKNEHLPLPMPPESVSTAQLVDDWTPSAPSRESAMPAPEKPADSGLAIVSRILRFGFRVPSAPRTIDTIVLHSSYNILGGDPYSVDQTIAEYEQYGVGAHYLIDRSGTILRLVEESNIAYHAGSSKMTDGRKNVNDFSIGIEMIATEESGYTEKQYTAVNALIADIKTRYKIQAVVGHSDIAPGRKTDPWKFDWKKLQ